MSSILWECSVCHKEVDIEHINTLTTNPDSQLICNECCENEAENRWMESQGGTINDKIPF